MRKTVIPQHRVKADEISSVLDNMILHGEVVSSSGNIYQMKCFAQEDETALKIAKILAEAPSQVDISPALNRIRSDLGIALSQRQTEAVYMAFRVICLSSQVPGTGKTTVLRAVIEVFKQINPGG